MEQTPAPPVEKNAERPCYRPEFDPARHLYCWYGTTLPSVTTVLRAANVLPVPAVDQATLFLAAERGTLIHAACTKVDDGVSDGIREPALQGYMRAYRAFMESKAFTPVHEWTEQPLCDPQLQVAGTPDRVGYTADAFGTVVDLKTPTLHERGYGVQLAAYRYLLRTNGFKAPRRMAVYLRPNGTFKVREFDDPGDDAAFLAALTLYRWRLRQKGKVAL